MRSFVQVIAAARFLLLHRLRWGTSIAARWAQFAVSAGIFGAALAHLVTGVPQYQLYFVIGLIAAGIFSISTLAGNDLLSDAQYGVDDYLLALPVSRRTLFAARIASSGTIAAVTMGLPAVALLAITGAFSGMRAFAAISLAVAGGAGLAGLGLAIAASSSNFEGFLVVNGFLEAFLIRLSAAFYPIAAMPLLFQAIARYNPISHLAWLGQRILGYPEAPGGSWILSVAFLVAWIVVALMVGDLAFGRSLQGRRVR